MRRIIWKYFFVSIFVVTVNQTGIIGFPGAMAQTGR